MDSLRDLKELHVKVGLSDSLHVWRQ
jgi:hypothetical protein